jgi:putative membrane protein
MIRFKQISIFLAVFGVAISTALVAWYGTGRVIEAALSVGPRGFAFLLAWQCVLFLALGQAWAVQLPGIGLLLPVWGRMVRDAAGNCLPFSQVGGYVLGARTMALHGIAWPRAIASTVVDLTAEFVAQLLFAGFGLMILLLHQPHSVLAWPVAIGLGCGLLAGSIFIGMQKGAAPLLRFLAARIAGDRFGDTSLRVGAVQLELDALYRAPGRLVAGIAFHLLGWICSGVASWISYRLLGASISLISALAIEALLTAALSLAFAIPGYAGVQEAAFAALGSAYGLAPDLSLGVSILRRARDLAVGIPILLCWQAMEARRLRAESGAVGH